MLWEYILSAITAVGSVLGSLWAIKSIIKYEEKVCNRRMEAFKEGLDRREKDN